MSRSQWKGPYINKNSLNKIDGSTPFYEKPTISRNTTILPGFVNETFQIYNGKKFTEILVTEEMIGHKFGEFSVTRKRFSFKKKKTKK